MLDHLIQGDSLKGIPEECTEALINYCRKRVEQHILNDELLIADDINHILENLIICSYEIYNMGSLCRKKEEIKTSIDNLHLQIEEVGKKLQFELEDHQHITFFSLELEEEEWAETQLKFDLDTDKNPSPKFRKLSGKLLNMGEIEKYLISSKKFKEAMNLKEVNDKLEKEELSAMEEAFLLERAAKKEQMRFHHLQKLECIKCKAKRKKLKITKKGENKIASLKNALHNLIS